MAKKITILGSTGSIGTNAIKLINSHPGKFEVQALTASKNIQLLAEQAKSLNAKLAVTSEEHLYLELKELLSGTNIKVAAGQEALEEAASMQTDIVLNAVVGTVGLRPTMAAINAGHDIAIANKETIVCGGKLITEAAKQKNIHILPVDSEHNALFQVLNEAQRDSIEKLTLTASGGPFLRHSYDDMQNVTIEQALAHPNWKMGPKVTIDSATMVNKGLELIEAHFLFDFPEDKIDIIIHPESIIHGMVHYNDGSVLAQLGCPDMITPISYALEWPNRIATTANKLSLTKLGQLTFIEPDLQKFPSVRIAREVLRQGGVYPIAFNATNEIIVQAFLAGKLKFIEIVPLIERMLNSVKNQELTSIEEVLSYDQEVRRITTDLLEKVNI
jgi:1-deoxy-D-xylulose-5-phosphate reductoisomerase